MMICVNPIQIKEDGNLYVLVFHKNNKKVFQSFDTKDFEKIVISDDKEKVLELFNIDVDEGLSS